MKTRLFSLFVLLFALALLVGACSLVSPSASQLPTLTSEPPLSLLGSLTATIASPSATPQPSATATLPPATVPATATQAAPTNTSAAPVATEVPPTATPTIAPSATPTGPAFDPSQAYGKPARVDPMDDSSFGSWKSDGVLPNTEYIKIAIKKDQFYVTGKKPLFSTWWFSWPKLDDFYIQMEVNSGNCGGQDAYGLILRGPEKGAGKSFGYVVAFTCDGGYWVFRLDGADPYSAVDLIEWTPSDLIVPGPNKENLLGVKAEGKVLTIYANGHELAQVSDQNYRVGRYGLFVRAANGEYTFQPLEIAYWELPGE